MREFRISEVCNVISGGTPSTKISSYWNGDVVWLTPKDLSNNKSKYIYDSENKITEEGLSRSSTQLLPPNTVLLSSRAPIGYLAIAGKSLCTNQGFKSMVCNQDLIIPEYLYYLLQTKVEDFNNISTGSTFKELSSSLLKQYKISIHDLPEQSHIVDTVCYSSLTVLKRLDGKAMIQSIIPSSSIFLRILYSCLEEVEREPFAKTKPATPLGANLLTIC